MVLVADPHEGFVPVDDPGDGLTPIADPLHGFTPVGDPFDGFLPTEAPLPYPTSQSAAAALPAVAINRAAWLRHRAAWTHAGWFDAPLRPAAQRLLTIAPGPALVAALSNLAVRGLCPADPVTGHSSLADPSAPGRVGVGRPGQPCACMIVIAAAWTAVSSWADARQTRAVVNAVGAEPVTVTCDPEDPRMGTIVDPAVDELAPALRLSPRSCAVRVASARALREQPDLMVAVEAGLVSSWAARLVTQDLQTLSAAERDVVIDRLLVRVTERHRDGLRAWTFSELRAAVTRIVARVAVDFAKARRRARQGRRVSVHDLGDGMAELIAELPADIAHRIYGRLTAISRDLSSDDSRSRDQQRADVLADLILDRPVDTAAVPDTTVPPRVNPSSAPPGSPAPGSAGPDQSAQSSSAPPGSPETRPRPRPCGHCGEADVVIDLATLLGMASDPAMLAGCGPIPSDIARELAADRAWRLWITDSTTGHLVATSASTYRPPTALARLIRAREPYCRFPGCRTTAEHCDLDHAIPWPEGSTSARNLGALCRRHHRLKTHTNWLLNTDMPAPGKGLAAGGSSAASENFTASKASGSGSGSGASAGAGARADDLAPPALHWTSPAGITSYDDPPRPLLDP